jgi:murein L,D-transpeptidase YafK
MFKPIYGLIIALSVFAFKTSLPDSKLAKSVRLKVWSRLRSELNEKKLKPGNALYIRIFKQENDMEIWEKDVEKYRFFKRFNFCFFSGGLGPKTREGDRKSPEGFYVIRPWQLNPASRYYLAINIDYPNRIEQAKGWTGDAIMIHGHCASDGCYAMTNDGIEEIYTLVYEAFDGGQQAMHLDIFPFRMDDLHMKKYAKSSVISFWKNIKPGFDLFQKNHIPSDAGINGREYKFKE